MNKKTLDELTSRLASVTSMFDKMANSLATTTTTMVDASRRTQNPGQSPQGQKPPDFVTGILDQIKTPLQDFLKYVSPLESYSNTQMLSKMVPDPDSWWSDKRVPDEEKIKGIVDSMLGAVNPLITGALTYGIATTVIPEVGKFIIGEFVGAMKVVADVQAKALATGLEEADILGEFNVAASQLRSPLLDMESELLKLREIGIRGLNTDTTKLADRMLFTGQNVNVLGKFLTSNALAIGLNTQQAEALAQEIMQSTVGYEASQQAILEAAMSLQEVSNKVNALAGTGPELTKLMAVYTSRFGVEKSEDLKTALSFLLDSKNQTFIRSQGLVEQVNRLLSGQASPEEMRALMQQITERLKFIAPKATGVQEFQRVEAALNAYSISTQQRQSMENLATTKFVENMGDSYSKVVVFKDVLVGVTNEMQNAAKGMMTGLTSFLGKDNRTWEDLRTKISVVFQSLFSVLDTSLVKKGLEVAKSILPDSLGGILDQAGQAAESAVTGLKGGSVAPTQRQQQLLQKTLDGLLANIGPSATADDRKLLKGILDEITDINAKIDDPGVLKSITERFNFWRGKKHPKFMVGK
jgi:hypothetical protein